MTVSSSVVPVTTVSMGMLGLLLMIGSAPISGQAPVVKSELLLTPHGRTDSLRIGSTAAGEPAYSPANRIRDAFDQLPGPKPSLTRPRNNRDDVIISC